VFPISYTVLSLVLTRRDRQMSSGLSR
jgi:hypothetical protein